MQAQEQKDSIAERVHDIPEVMVQARRMPAKVSTTASVQVIGKEDIRNLGLQNVSDAVRAWRLTATLRF